jgi:hypothetical protein
MSSWPARSELKDRWAADFRGEKRLGQILEIANASFRLLAA